MELKLDWVRDILKTVEQSPDTRVKFEKLVPLGESREQVFYHVWQMKKNR